MHKVDVKQCESDPTDVWEEKKGRQEEKTNDKEARWEIYKELGAEHTHFQSDCSNQSITAKRLADLIDLVHIEEKIELWVKDNGVGLSHDFDLTSGDLGLGVDIIVALTDQIDAELSFYNKHGASFKISFQNMALDWGRSNLK